MGLLEKQFDVWKLERMWKMEGPMSEPEQSLNELRQKAEKFRLGYPTNDIDVLMAAFAASVLAEGK